MRHRNVVGLTAVAAAGILVARRWQLRWGATAQESGGSLPGDDLVSDPDLVATRAISVSAVTDQVWPWIAQLGQGRGGFYSYELLENLAGCDIHSADQIVPGWQDVEVGDDQIRLAPPVALAVARLERGRSLVLRGGVPMGNTHPPMTSPGLSCSGRTRSGQRGCSCGKDTPTPGRGHGSSSSQPKRVSFVMSQKMLRGIRAGPSAWLLLPPQSPTANSPQLWTRPPARPS
jgi:hypothetical protein